jgi:uncharacterized SAM-binding protein YcdF (DUF218 family)
MGCVTTAIVVLGNGRVARDGAYRISAACRLLVREAERLAPLASAELVVFTGWSANGEPSEAEQMRRAWRGVDTELVIEPTARTTAQNAARTLPLLSARGIGRAVVVTTPLHRYRTRFFFSRLFAAAGIETVFRAAPVPPSARALAWELAALPACGLQLRSARAELARARASP